MCYVKTKFFKFCIVIKIKLKFIFYLINSKHIKVIQLLSGKKRGKQLAIIIIINHYYCERCNLNNLRYLNFFFVIAFFFCSRYTCFGHV